METVQKKKQKILVCMSGGVDSSVAAAFLARQGHDVTGAFMVNYDSGRAPVGDPDCWLTEYRDALRVAARLGIPLLKLDFTKEYSKKVLAYMFREYKKGRTPNPDVLCNTFIKFGVWLKWARKHGFDKLATGHYARLKIQRPKSKGLNPSFALLAAKDENKDQTYFLHQLSQKQLANILFPIGEYAKPKVRKLAKKFGLPTAEKEESMGVCFVGEVPMKEFLSKKVPAKSGKVITAAGEAIGRHDGLPFYTIGQRHGFEQSGGKAPLFVVAKDFKKNLLIVGYEDDPGLFQKEIAVSDIHWVIGQVPDFPLHCEVRLRHRQPLQESKIWSLAVVGESRLRIEFKTLQRAVTPGQFAVLYENGVCLGGGVIEKYVEKS